MTANKVVISLSGGLDSTCLLLKLLSEGKEVHAYSFKYGQKHEIELTKVKKNIKFLQNKGFKVTHQIIDLTDVFSDSASSLHQGGEAIPYGDYREESMKSTVVENRNVIFGSIIYGKALSWANKTNSNVLITLGLHAGDHCFTSDTKIITPNGYKTIKDLKQGDPVFSFNPNTLKIEVDKCIDIIEKGTNNEIFNINTTTGSLKVTGEHKVYVVSYGELDRNGYSKSIEKKTAKELKVGDILMSTNTLPGKITAESKTINVYNPIKEFINSINGYNVDIENGNIIIYNSNGKMLKPCKEEMDAKSLLNIMAWYITEGMTSKQYEKNSKASRFLSSFTQSFYKNLENCESINEDLNNLNINISVSKSKKLINNLPKEYTYQFTGAISVLMQTCGNGSANKSIPNWIMNFLKENKEYIYDFVNTMVSGDGHYDKISGIYTYSSKSKQLIEDLSYLIKSIGFYVKCAQKNNIYIIQFGNKTRKQGLIRFGDAAMTKITDVSISHEEEKVYDITVEKNHNFFAGELGNILISNSIYPDCRPESQQAAEYLFKISNWGSEKVDYIAPFINIDKMHVLQEGVNAMKNLNFTQEEIMEVLKNTHTCYDPDSEGRSCSKCGSCCEREESFAYVGFMDPIEYQDPEYAKKKYEEFYKKYHK